MHIYEWLTILAILAGPVAAVLVQLFFEKRRETRKRKLHILDILMANRARLLALETVQALNQIEIVFYDTPSVRNKWKELFSQFERIRGLTGADLEESARKRDDLLVELISLMATSMGYDLSHTLIKGQRYNPQAFVDEEKYQMETRKAFLPILKGERSLLVKLDESDDIPPTI